MANIGTPLSQVVHDYLLAEERDSMHKFPIYLHYAVKAVKDLHADVDGYTKSVKLTPSKGVANLPADFVKEVRISVLDSSGNLIFLGRNPNIFKDVDDCGDLTTPQQAAGSAGFTGYNWANTSQQHFKNGEIVGAFYGAGGRSTAGEFNMNYRQGRIELGTSVSATTIILEYIAQPTPVNGQFLVHPYMEKPILDYIRWMKIAYKDGYSQGQIQGRFISYVNAKQWAKMRMQGMSVEDLLDISRRHFSMSPKY